MLNSRRTQTLIMGQKKMREQVAESWGKWTSFAGQDHEGNYYGIFKQDNTSLLRERKEDFWWERLTKMQVFTFLSLIHPPKWPLKPSDFLSMIWSNSWELLCIVCLFVSFICKPSSSIKTIILYYSLVITVWSKNQWQLQFGFWSRVATKQGWLLD